MTKTKAARLYAFLIDHFIYSFLASLFISMISIAPSQEMYRFRFLELDMVLWLQFSGIAVFIYFLFFDFFTDGRSIGKMLLKIKVVQQESLEELPMPTRIKRTLLKLCSIALLPLSMLLFLFADEFTLQDKYAKTVTVAD